MADLLFRYASAVRFMVRMVFFAGGLALVVLPIRILMVLKPDWAHRLCAWIHRYSCRCFNVRVDAIGEPAGHRTDEPVLYVINHISWLDIVVIGGLVRGCFVAKAELETWPVFGPLADLQRTIYVRREERHRAGDQKNGLANRIVGGDDVLLFPEGTSGLGNMVLPFKTTLFGVTDDPRLHNLLIQPVTLSYNRLNGLPLLRAQRSLIAWVGDMTFGAHALALLRQGSIGAVVQFHAPVRRSAYASRKHLARACEQMVAENLRLANSGRIEMAVAAPVPDRL